jgi:hypothetical protein
VYHAVSFSFLFYGVNSSSAVAGETAEVMTWVPDGCTATKLAVLSQQGSSTMVVTLRTGMPGGTMSDTALHCSPASGGSCTATGSVTIAPGSFVDLGIAHADGNAAGVWTVLACS